MTKEMNPSHRIDVLTHSLLYYSQQKIRNLGEINYKALVFIVNVKIYCEGSHLCEQLKRAERINMIASSKLVGSKMSGQSFDRSSKMIPYLLLFTVLKDDQVTTWIAEKEQRMKKPKSTMSI